MTRPSLLRKIGFPLALVFAFGGIAFGTIMMKMVDRFESELLDQTTQNELELWLNLHRAGLVAEMSPLHGRRFYLLDEQGIEHVPMPLRHLQPGTFHDVEVNGSEYHVVVADAGGSRVMLAMDIKGVESAEKATYLVYFLGAGILILAVFMSILLLARHAVSPVQSLAERVHDLQPGELFTPIGPDYSDYEVGQIADAIDRFREKLQEFVRREQMFTSAVSHELRTPLSVISTSSEVLEVDPHQSPVARQVIDRIRRSSRQMNDIMTSLLFLARQDRSGSNLSASRTDFSALLHEVVTDHRLLLRGDALTLTASIESGVKLAADESHLRMISNNLLRNSIDHTPSGSVVVSLTQTFFVVADSGCGIEAGHLGSVFERDFSDFKHHGIGLGLYLCKQLCDRYQWAIELDSTPGEGTRVTVYFQNAGARFRLTRV